MSKKDLQINSNNQNTIRLFLDDLSGYLRIGRSEKDVLGYIFKYVKINNGEILLNKITKELIVNESGLKLSLIESAICNLHKNKLILRPFENRSAVYYINPIYFWKGTDTSRFKTVQKLSKLIPNFVKISDTNVKVYVIHNTELNTYKIGKSINPTGRLKELQTSNSSKLKIIYEFESNDGNQLETSLHRIFSSKRISGEWFKLSDTDLLILSRIQTYRDPEVQSLDVVTVFGEVN